MSDQSQFISDIIISVTHTAKLQERLAILEIIIEELKWTQTPGEIDALDRVAAAIKHRTKAEL